MCVCVCVCVCSIRVEREEVRVETGGRRRVAEVGGDLRRGWAYCDQTGCCLAPG